MKNTTKILLLSFFFVSPDCELKAQTFEGLGFSLNHNYAIQNNGVGLRYNLPLSPKIDLVPQLKYQPKFNAIHEAFAGLMLHYRILDLNSLGIYGLGGVDANYWLNHFPSVNSRAKAFNVLPKVGAGLEIPISFFAIYSEIKYNPLWNESYSELGIRIRRSGRSKRNRQLDCPKIF